MQRRCTELFFNIRLKNIPSWVVRIRIAYCLTVHTRPEQTGRLLDRIECADDHYYVDVFNKGLEEKWRQVLDRPPLDIETVFKYANGWGSFKLVQATLDAMGHFREMPYDYFINLSGQCYPLRPVEQIKQRLAAENSRSLMEYEPFPRERWADERGGYRRVQRIFFRPFKHANVWSVPRLRKMPLGMRPYGGSQWFCLHKKHVEYVLSFLEAGASYDNFRNYNPFALQRSAGAGLRVFMPAFGLLGIDFGYGFDPVPGDTQRSGNISPTGTRSPAAG